MTGRALAASLVAILAASALALPAAAHPAAKPTNNVVYEILVRSFADSNGDGVGDLRGLTSRLASYLNDGDPSTDRDLEVGILWLLPIFPSPSYHGYDVTDFRTVKPEYGTLDDFETLLAEAHKRGVRVILDVPFNHTSNRHPWFEAALADPSSKFRKYYLFEPDDGTARPHWHSVVAPSGERLRYLGLFGGHMPDLDFDNPDVRREVESITEFWLSLGVDGFRLDAAKHIYGGMEQVLEPEILANNRWWSEFSRFVYGKRPDAILVGEVLGDREIMRRHAWGLDGLVDAPFMHEAREQAAFPREGFVQRFKDSVVAARSLNRESDESEPGPARRFDSFAYLASHDENPRLASWFEDAKGRGARVDADPAYRLGMYFLLTLPTYAIVYQGDELMQRGRKWNGSANGGDGSGIFDETLREPFPWYRSGSGAGQTTWFASRYDRPDDGVSREEQDRAGTVFDLVRGLINLRAEHPALDAGDVGAILADSADWMVFERVLGRDSYLVLVNLTAKGNDYRFHATWFPRYRRARLVFWSDGVSKTWKDVSTTGSRIRGTAHVPPYGLVVLRR